jgi:type III polyketide synthase
MLLNSKTQIHRRQTILDFSEVTDKDAEPPTIDTLSQVFRRDGVDLAVSACTKAMKDANVSAAGITHVVAVTCTDQGNPGYDLLVCEKLGLPRHVQRTLLHGTGCAGGLSALRSAADTAAASSQKNRPARVLVICCELCSLFLRAELQAASQDDALHIAPTLFSDAAAALVHQFMSWGNGEACLCPIRRNTCRTRSNHMVCRFTSFPPPRFVWRTNKSL